MTWRLPIGPCVITGINSLLSMATPCVTQWGIPGHVGKTSTGLNGSPFPVVKITCSNLLKVGEGEFDNSSLHKKLQHSRNKEQRKRRKKMSNSVSPVGPEFKVTKLGELHMGPSVYLVTTCLFVCYSWTRRAPSGPSSSHVKLGELHKGPSSVLSKFVELVFLLVSNVRSGLILDKSIYNNFCVGTSMRNSTT